MVFKSKAAFPTLPQCVIRCWALCCNFPLSCTDNTWKHHKPLEALACPVSQDLLGVLVVQDLPGCLDGRLHRSPEDLESLRLSEMTKEESQDVNCLPIYGNKIKVSFRCNQMPFNMY